MVESLTMSLNPWSWFHKRFAGRTPCVGIYNPELYVTWSQKSEIKEWDFQDKQCHWVPRHTGEGEEEHLFYFTKSVISKLLLEKPCCFAFNQSFPKINNRGNKTNLGEELKCAAVADIQNGTGVLLLLITFFLNIWYCDCLNLYLFGIEERQELGSSWSAAVAGI